MNTFNGLVQPVTVILNFMTSIPREEGKSVAIKLATVPLLLTPF
jgi:hypothetical protein